MVLIQLNLLQNQKKNDNLSCGLVFDFISRPVTINLIREIPFRVKISSPQGHFSLTLAVCHSFSSTISVT